MKRYCGQKFKEIFEMNNISDNDLMESLDVNKNRKMIFKAGESAGKSGSFFFFSFDNKFIIKTLKGNEKHFLINILDDYIEHLKMSEDKSLIARIFGIFEIKTDYFDKMDLIVMENTVQLYDKKYSKI